MSKNLSKNVPVRPERAATAEQPTQAAPIDHDGESTGGDEQGAIDAAFDLETEERYQEDQRANQKPVDEVTRENRRPFGTQRQKLAYAQRPGFHRHWFNDVPGRIPRATEAGYKHVIGDDGRPVKLNVGTREGGGGLIAFLMEIPQEWYEDDQRAKQRPIDEIEEQIRKGQVGRKEDDGRYVPEGAISIRRGR